MLCRKGFENVNTCLINGLFFFERCSLIPATMFANKFSFKRTVFYRTFCQHLMKKSLVRLFLCCYMITVKFTKTCWCFQNSENSKWKNSWKQIYTCKKDCIAYGVSWLSRALGLVLIHVNIFYDNIYHYWSGCVGLQQYVTLIIVWLTRQMHAYG